MLIFPDTTSPNLQRNKFDNEFAAFRVALALAALMGRGLWAASEGKASVRGPSAGLVYLVCLFTAFLGF